MKMNDYSNLEKEDLLKVIAAKDKENKKLRTNKRYGIVWDVERTQEKFEEESENAFPILEEIKSKEITSDLYQSANVLIEGDNYHALSVLNYTHRDKIDIIYIDPPYNTGRQDFKYNDRYVDKEDTFRHSKWLSFMEKRLILARNLLCDDGIIFISIDDNELAHLKMLCDEIFGEDNLLSKHHIQVRYANKSLNEKKDFQEILEYCLIYAKNKQFFNAKRPTEEYKLDDFHHEIKLIKDPDKSVEIDGKKVDVFLKGSYTIEKKQGGSIDLFKETWISGSIFSGTGHGSSYKKIIEPRSQDDGLSTLYRIHGLGDDGLGFRYMVNPQKKSAKRGKMFTKIPVNKREAIKQGPIIEYKPIINCYDWSADFGNISSEGGISFNSGKKPIKMLKHLINYHSNKNAKVLDFFAGSGSTGHAVLDLNKEDGGDRKFILCAKNEENICSDICYPRIKNVIKGYKKTKGIQANLKYYKTKFLKKSIHRDDIKMQLAKKCSEIICLKENIFNKLKTTDDYYIFSENERVLAIYHSLTDHGLDALKKELNKMQGEKILYCFSFDPYGLDKDIQKNWYDVRLEVMPQKLLETYEQILKY